MRPLMKTNCCASRSSALERCWVSPVGCRLLGLHKAHGLVLCTAVNSVPFSKMIQE